MSCGSKTTSSLPCTPANAAAKKTTISTTATLSTENRLLARNPSTLALRKSHPSFQQKDVAITSTWRPFVDLEMRSDISSSLPMQLPARFPLWAMMNRINGRHGSCLKMAWLIYPYLQQHPWTLSLWVWLWT